MNRYLGGRHIFAPCPDLSERVRVVQSLGMGTAFLSLFLIERTDTAFVF
jgi:hypothetical protein